MQPVKEAEQHRRRGIQFIKAGQLAAALQTLGRAVQLDEKSADAHHALGVALLHNGQFAEAAASFRRAIAFKPDFANAYSDLGIALDRQGFDAEAVEAYRSAIALAPKRAEVHRRLAELYQMHGKIEDAVDSYQRAAAGASDATAARLFRVKALILGHNVREAKLLLRKLIALDSTNGEAESTLADVLVIEGRFEEGLQHFDRALQLDERLFPAWLGMARARRFTETDRPRIMKLRALLTQPDLDDRGRMVLNFALGKILDDLKDYGGAMRCFDAANRIRGRSVSFDQAGFAKRVDRLISRFTPGFLAQESAFGTADETPLLILGMPRSGTTLVEQIISRHPAIAAGDEQVFWTSHGANWEAGEGPGFTPAAGRALAGDYLRVLHQIGPAATRVTDKLPFNFLRLGLIHLLLPRARIIHCRRNPLDTCLSIYSILFAAQMGFAASKTNLAFYYQQYARLTDHWRAVLPADRFLEVEYEKLIFDRETETRRLIAFTGLGWNDACLQPERNDRIVNTASSWQARQPVYATAVERWRHYEPWLGELACLLPDAAFRPNVHTSKVHHAGPSCCGFG
jgi:Flp pilus assembly protein TadD